MPKQTMRVAVTPAVAVALMVDIECSPSSLIVLKAFPSNRFPAADRHF